MTLTYTRRYTTTSTGRYDTYTYTYTSKSTFYDHDYYPTRYYRSSDDSSAHIAIGVIFGLCALGLIIAAIVFFLRQKKRKAWYGQMAAHYHNGGLPPSTLGVVDKAQLSPNNSPTQSSYPKAQYENPTQFGVYSDLSTAPYKAVTDVTDYTGTPSLSPQPQHSQYSNTASSFEPNNAAPTVRHSIVYARPLSIPTQTNRPTSSIHGTPAHHGGVLPNAQTYATQTSSLSSHTHGAHSFYGRGQINAVTYNSPSKRPEYAETSGPAQGPVHSGGPPEHVEASGPAQALVYTGDSHSVNDSTPKEPEYVEASGSSHAPAYSVGPYGANDLPARGPEYTEAPAYSGGPYSANDYPRGKEQRYTVPSAGKQ